MTNSEGRRDIDNLDQDALYLIEGTFSGFYSTDRDHVSRIALREVFIREYDTSRRLQDLPVVGICDHINSIRKNSGLEYSKLREGERCDFIGKPMTYESSAHGGKTKYTFKLFRGTNVHQELVTVEKRIRNCVSSWDSTELDKVSSHLERTKKLTERLVDVLANNKMMIPYITSQEATKRVVTASSEIDRLIEVARLEQLLK